jgi:hypothetical protein
VPEPDRSAFARRNAAWLLPAFAAVLLLGLLRGNIWAVLAGVGGLGWVIAALWQRR